MMRAIVPACDGDSLATPMHFDDRLATVLRSETGGQRAARTQYRQLLDLLGSTGANNADMPLETYRKLAAQADGMTASDKERMLLQPALESRNHRLLTFLGMHRLEELGEDIPAEERSRILREPGLRLRNRELVAFLAQSDPKTAASAIATARLSEEDWQILIPQLSATSRGFLRHRRDLSESTRQLLKNMGVRDNALPLPESAIVTKGDEAEAAPARKVNAPEAVSAASAVPPAIDQSEKGKVRDLLRRIEAFREGKIGDSGDPRLPLGDTAESEVQDSIDSFSFSLDIHGRINWADEAIAPLVVGMRPGTAQSGALAAISRAASTALTRHQILRAEPVEIDAAPEISGQWRMDAAPQFSPDQGNFTGYIGRMRRPVIAADEPSAANLASNQEADRMRQVLHELRTPVNAIQGFAEIIQQQLFGPAPNEYRAHAAAIAVDAAKLLAGFDEVDRLSKLQTGAMTLEEGQGDLRLVVNETIMRLHGVLRARNSGFNLSAKGEDFVTAIDKAELAGICWRIFASLSAALAPSETLKARLSSNDHMMRLRCRLPQKLAKSSDIFQEPIAENRPAVSSGMFGSGFSLRLARAEIEAAGGSFVVEKKRIKITLPVLTRAQAANSNEARDGNAA